MVHLLFFCWVFFYCASVNCRDCHSRSRKMAAKLNRTLPIPAHYEALERDYLALETAWAFLAKRRLRRTVPAITAATGLSLARIGIMCAGGCACHRVAPEAGFFRQSASLEARKGQRAAQTCTTSRYILSAFSSLYLRFSWPFKP